MQLHKAVRFEKVVPKLLALPAVFALAGCISSSSPPPPAEHTTVVVPPGSTVVCPAGSVCR